MSLILDLKQREATCLDFHAAEWCIATLLLGEFCEQVLNFNVCLDVVVLQASANEKMPQLLPRCVKLPCALYKTLTFKLHCFKGIHAYIIRSVSNPTK